MDTKRKSIVSTEMKKNDLATEIMERMVELEFDVEDAETFPAFLEQNLKKKNRSLFTAVTDEF